MIETLFIVASTLICGFGFWLRGSYKFEQAIGRGPTTAGSYDPAVFDGTGTDTNVGATLALRPIEEV